MFVLVFLLLFVVAFLLLVSSFNLNFTLLFQIFTFYEQVGFNAEVFMKQLLKGVSFQMVPSQRIHPSLTFLGFVKINNNNN